MSSDQSLDEEIRRQILDENKRSWSISEYENDPDIFFTRVILPLRKLRDKGKIEGLDEPKFHINGDSRITNVEIIGAIDLDL